MKITIQNINNGYLVTTDDRNGDISQNVFEEDIPYANGCDRETVKRLLYHILFSIDESGSKHDEHRISIHCIHENEGK